MVGKQNEELKCGSCSECIGDVWNGYVYCAFLGCDVWAGSLMCQHGKDLQEIF